VDADQLFRQHGPSLMRYLIRLTADADAAADALQETFVRFVQAPAHTNPRAWIFTVATNIVREQGRAHTRRRELLQAAPLDALHGDEPPTPEHVYWSDENRRIVAAALARLSEKDRTALLMREEGFTHEEIAAAVGTTTKSVGTVIARALRKLAAELRLGPGDLA
jgi:RNA polymerase sigma factor (sigma-70 family)